MNPVDLDYAIPFPLQTGRVRAAPLQVKATHAIAGGSSKTGDSIYKAGDLAIVDASGYFTKLIETTPANIAGVFQVGHDYTQEKVLTNSAGETPYLANASGDIIPPDENWVFTYQGNAANNANYTMQASDVALFKSGAKLELIFNTVEGVMTVRNGTTNPNVQVVSLFAGGVGKVNPRIVVAWLSGMLRLA